MFDFMNPSSSFNFNKDIDCVMFEALYGVGHFISLLLKIPINKSED